MAMPAKHINGCRGRSPSTAASSPTITTTPATMPPTTAPEIPPSPPPPLVPPSDGGSADAVLGGAGTGYLISGSPSAERSCACVMHRDGTSHPFWHAAASRIVSSHHMTLAHQPSCAMSSSMLMA